MNHEETIKRIQSLVPSVMALEFGCEVEGWKRKGVRGVDKVICKNKEGMIQVLMCDDRQLCAWQYVSNNLKILGKPITISIVLMAIEESRDVWLGFELRNQQLILLEYWNLSKDNFNDQSEETKTFIGGLLGN